MNWLEIGVIGAVVFAVYYMQQIKITLKDKGHDVGFFTGWLADYRSFKGLIAEEADEEARNGYQRILNGLYLALAGVVAIPLLMIYGR